MIPVLGVPVLNRPELLQAMFDTIDYGPIDRLFIIDNGGVIPGNIKRWPTHVNRYHVANPGYNMGVAASWNHIIKANMNAPWWLIVNNDVKFEPGILQRLVEEVTDEPAVWRIEMGNESTWGSHFGAFAINAGAVERVGWFDENIYPVYWEDTDFVARANALELPLHLLKSPRTFHEGNASWKRKPELGKANDNSWKGNVAYFTSRWGSEDDGWKTPEDPSTWQPPRLSRFRHQQWPVDYKDSGKV